MSLMDLVEREQSILNIILTKLDYVSSNYIYQTCKTFKKITENDMKQLRIEYITNNMTSLFEKLIENKAFSIHDNTGKYKKTEEYDEDIENIVNSIPIEILKKNAQNVYKSYKDAEIDSNTASHYICLYEYIANQWKIVLYRYFKSTWYIEDKEELHSDNEYDENGYYEVIDEYHEDVDNENW